MMNKVQQSIVLTGLTIAVISLFMIILGNHAFALEYTESKWGMMFQDPWNTTSDIQKNKFCNNEIKCLIVMDNIHEDQLSTITILAEKGEEFENNCQCDSLIDFVQFDYNKTYDSLSDFYLIGDNQTTLNENISAWQMEYSNINKNNDNVINHLILWTSSNDIFYKISYHGNAGIYSTYLPSFKEFLNSLKFVKPVRVSEELQSGVQLERKQPSFMISKNENEPLSQKESIPLQSQQQISELKVYQDPSGKFSLDYDPSLWIAIPDQNRFDDIDVQFADKTTGGVETAITIGLTNDPLPHLSIKEMNELVLPSYLGDNPYEDKQLEEGVECERMTIQGNDVCSFIFSEPPSYFKSYPRDYFMMVTSKIGNEMFTAVFNAQGDKFNELEQNVIKMINSMQIIK